MSNRDDDKEKDSGAQSGSGRPATKFMERPKPGKFQDPSQAKQEPAEGETPGSESSSEEESGLGTGQTPGQPWKQGQGQQKPGQQQQKKQGQSGQQGKDQEPE